MLGWNHLTKTIYVIAINVQKNQIFFSINRLKMTGKNACMNMRCAFTTKRGNEMSVEIVPNELDDFLGEKKISLSERLHSIVMTATNMDVSSEEAFRKMTSLYADSKECEKRIEFIRKQANQPDQEKINARNDKAKEILAPLKQIQMIAKSKCEGYQLILEQKKIEEQKKIQEDADLLGLEEAPILMPLEKSKRGDGAIMYTRTVRKFRMVDLSKVPLKYLQLNEDLIKQDISLGICEIPGIEIYEDKITQLKTR